MTGAAEMKYLRRKRRTKIKKKTELQMNKWEIIWTGTAKLVHNLHTMNDKGQATTIQEATIWTQMVRGKRRENAMETILDRKKTAVKQKEGAVSVS